MTALTHRVPTFASLVSVLYMSNQTIIILVIVALIYFMWIPAIIFSIRRSLRKDRQEKNKQ